MSIPSCPARLARDENIQTLWPVAAQSGSPLLPRLIAWAESGGTVDAIAAIYSAAREAIGVAIADHDADPEYASAAGYEWGPDNDSSHADITATAAALAAVAAAAWSAAACAAAEAAAAADARVSAVRRAIAREVSARPVAGPVAGPLRSALLAWRGDLAGIEQICAEADAAADAERLDADDTDDDTDECWAPFRDDLPAAVAAMIAENALSATHDGSSLDDRISPEAITSFISLWGHPIGS